MSESKVSIKSTKSEIMKAYNEALAKLEQKSVSPEEEAGKQSNMKLKKDMGAISSEGISKGISQLKVSLLKELDGLSGSLTSEYEKLSQLNKVIKLEQTHLETLYGIKEESK